MKDRRQFIRSAAMATTLAVTATPASLIAKHKSGIKSISTNVAGTMPAGIQVYSVRNQLKEDFQGTMKTVSDIGYKVIEGYGLGLDGKFLGKFTPREYQKIIWDLGMNMVATHCSFFKPEDAPMMIESAKDCGVEYLIIPYIPGDLRKSIDDYKSIAEGFNKIGEECNKAGLKFAYHNHDFEFKSMEGTIPQEVLMDETEAGLVAFEADLYWVKRGAYDPVALIKKYPNRIHLFHVKDAAEDGEEATVGQGIIDFKSCFELGKESGLVHYFIEDERTDDPFSNIKANFEYITAQDFA